MQTGVMNHPGRDPIEEIGWIGRNGFDLVDFPLEPPAAAPEQVDAAAVRAALDRTVSDASELFPELASLEQVLTSSSD